MPNGPGAEVLEVEKRVMQISLWVMGTREQGGRGGGSVEREGSTGGGSGGKKQVQRVSAMVVRSEERPSGPQSGGTTLVWGPCCQQVALQRLEEL
jgi:hypothetical protein